ncbi:MAG: redoxin domain-containing protein, partial [Bacteroidetes bacterium]|nr:redoxin domain-containing protein [Bacteroidota bacterium]
MVPVISLPDQHGNLVNFDDFINKHPLVIYFYPKDDTPG